MKASFFLIVAPDMAGRPYYWVNRGGISWSPNRGDAQVMSPANANGTLDAWTELNIAPDRTHLEPVF